MSEFVVVNGAILRCSEGSAHPALNASMGLPIAAEGEQVATILDVVPGHCIRPFGVCKITGSPCAYAPASLWMPGISSAAIGPVPVLGEGSSLACTKGGSITVEDPGQSTLIGDGSGSGASLTTTSIDGISNLLGEQIFELLDALLSEEISDLFLRTIPLLAGAFWAYQMTANLHDQKCRKENLHKHLVKCISMPPLPPRPSTPAHSPVGLDDRFRDAARATSNVALKGATGAAAGAAFGATVASPALIVPGAGEVVEGGAIGVGAVAGGAAGIVKGVVDEIL